MIIEQDLDSTRRYLTNLLIRAPKRLHHKQWAFAGDLLERVGMPLDPSPVVGVATGGAGQREEVIVLLSRRIEFDTEALSNSLHLPRIRTEVSGPIVPAARPAQGGDSISGDGPGGETGTLGCLVKTGHGDILVLGCNHTLAGVNQCVVNRDGVRQPGVADGGTAADSLGTLTTFVPIQLGGYHPNIMDAAVAEPRDPTDVASGVRNVGAVNGEGLRLNYGDRVHKVGWTTQHTFGTFRYKVDYEQPFPTVGSTAVFVDQYGIVGDAGTFGQQGDSGAAVLSETSDMLVGLLIGVAVDMNLTLVSPIHEVLTTLGVSPL